MNRKDMLKKSVLVAAVAVTGTSLASASGAHKGEIKNVDGWLTSTGYEKHIPVVSVRRYSDLAKINVVIKHPQTTQHHIRAVRIYDANRKLVAEAIFSHTLSVPASSFELKIPVGTKLFAVTDCNLHSFWMKEFHV